MNNIRGNSFRKLAASLALVLGLAGSAYAGNFSQSNFGQSNKVAFYDDFQNPKLSRGTWTREMSGWYVINSAAGVWNAEAGVVKKESKTENNIVWISPNGGIIKDLGNTLEPNLHYKTQVVVAQPSYATCSARYVVAIYSGQQLVKEIQGFPKKNGEWGYKQLHFENPEDGSASGSLYLSIRNMGSCDIVVGSVKIKSSTSFYGDDDDDDRCDRHDNDHRRSHHSHRTTSTSSVQQAATLTTPGFSFRDSFEDLPLPAGANATPTPGWSNLNLFSGVSDTIPVFTTALPDGSKFAWMNKSGAIIKKLDTTLQPNYQYALRVDTGYRTDSGIPSYLIQLYSGTELLKETSGDLTQANGTWAPVVLTYETGAISASTDPMYIVIQNASTCCQLDIDNVRFVGSSK